MPPSLTERLHLILDWYKGMISKRTGRLVYTYYPAEDITVEDGSPIRDIASVWDVELLGRFLNRDDLLPLAERSLEHYAGYLVGRDGALVLDADRLGEPSSIAHSAFMLLSLLDSGVPGREVQVAGLAEGILGQQRPDGSYQIYFGDEVDEGLEFYPGEAMLAWMRAYASAHDARYLASVERGFDYYRQRFPANAVAADLHVFYANWQSQYAVLLHEHTHGHTVRMAVRDYVFALHDQVLHTGFYDDLERHPMRQATVEVACALEGLNEAYTLATRERDAHRTVVYERCIRKALAARTPCGRAVSRQ